ncbi:MAG: aminotransferase class I/II-fold pyridoxal phosphate-dependent enzyme [Oscillospiraceae bacterium]|nr:aminotransferase class I/II-fold pyridoxal phosphate-dependent enzyme [Oscillospiraceae bacterium]
MLYEKLLEYVSNGIYPMHMPGHKRNAEFLSIDPLVDITEIRGFDNLHDPGGILRDTTELAAKLYGADKSFPLINGSTAGILAAIGACTKRGDKILMARNSHISVYNAVALFGLNPVYILPETDKFSGIACRIDPKAVELALEQSPDIKLVCLTSPTYEGVVSDIGTIADIVHRKGILLFADEAHGAHVRFYRQVPINDAMSSGADISVMSLHKTLPALTQCALLHVRGKLVDFGEISRLLAVFQTSSPSYVLLSSIDQCLRLLDSDGMRLFHEYEQNLADFHERTKQLRNLSVLRSSDPGKLVISTKKTALSGMELADILYTEHKIELEMASIDYALAMTSICDTAAGFNRLAKALTVIDNSTQLRPSRESLSAFLPVQAKLPGEVLAQSGDPTPLSNAVGLMSSEYVWAYPPGIPIIVPGEIIDEAVVLYITRLVQSGISPKSTNGRLPEYIYACDLTR